MFGWTAAPTKDSTATTKEPTLLGLVITTKCPCGKDMHVAERQQLVYNPNEDKWNRVCGSCLGKDRSFSSTTPRA